MPKWTDTKGHTHDVPPIDWMLCVRLKRWGVVDLVKALKDPEQVGDLFESLEFDGELIINFAYAIEHKILGTEEQQADFGALLVGGESGIGPLQDCSEALLESVINFFPSDRRAFIRTLHATCRAAQAVRTIQKAGAAINSEESDLATGGSGFTE